MADMIYGKEALSPRVISVLALDDYCLELAFNNGERRVFDAKPLLQHKIYAPLLNKGYFGSVSVAFGTIAWPGDIDFCPDTLYEQSVNVAAKRDNTSTAP